MHWGESKCNQETRRVSPVRITIHNDEDYNLQQRCARTTGHWMATGKAWGLASSLWEALLAWGAGGGPVEATAPTASTATY